MYCFVHTRFAHTARWLVLGALVALLAACTIPQIDLPTDGTGAPAQPEGEIQTLYVGPQLVPCTGVAPMECMQVRDTPDGEYENFFNSIEGFEFEPGYEYELRVMVEEIDNPPADGSSLRYSLVEIVSQTPVTTLPLEGTLWQLVEFAGADGTQESALPNSEGFILLENGELGGSAGCNSFFGTYEVENGTLTFGPVGSTLMACEEPLMSQERAVIDALTATTGYVIANGALTLQDAEGNSLAVFAAELPATPESDSEDANGDMREEENGEEEEDTTAPTGAIEDIRWDLVEVGTDGRLQPAVADAEAFLLLSMGDVSGRTGCNQFGGGRAYLLEGDELRFGEIVSTAMACLGPVNDQEALFFAGLQATRSYELRDGMLTLLDEDGTPVLVFEAGPADTAPEGETEEGDMGEGDLDIENGNADAETVSSEVTVEAAESTLPQLEDFLWLLTEYRNRAGELVAPVAEAEIQLVNGTLQGRTGCNTMNGPYTTQGEGLSFGAIATTRMGCAPDVAAQEFDLLQALRQVADYTLEETTLTLVDSDGAPVLVFAAP